MSEIRAQWHKIHANHYRAELEGPAGTIRAERLAVAHTDPEYLDWLYWECVKTVKGYYHCCLTGWVEWKFDKPLDDTKQAN